MVGRGRFGGEVEGGRDGGLLGGYKAGNGEAVCGIICRRGLGGRRRGDQQLECWCVGVSPCRRPCMVRWKPWLVQWAVGSGPGAVDAAVAGARPAPVCCYLPGSSIVAYLPPRAPSARPHPPSATRQAHPTSRPAVKCLPGRCPYLPSQNPLHHLRSRPPPRPAPLPSTHMAPQAGVNGVLPVQVLQKNTSAPAPRGPKAPSPRLKLICRRLPPGLTRPEFESALGPEWKVGQGKVDWLNYRKGKVSKDLAKPSKPSRAYIHLTQQPFVAALGDRVRELVFHDAAKSFQDPALVGPPVLEFAPYMKLPSNRKRNDARQGTIDQDPEFKEFLESLTAPITKPAAPDAEPQKEEKVKTTPLIEALRERKANKEKPQKKGRGEHKDDAVEKKILAKPAKENAPSEKGRKANRAEKEKAQREAVKALNKEASASKESALTEKTTPGPSAPASERKRGNVNIAKGILQRDLGLGPAPNRRRGTKREIGTTPAQDSTPKQEENVSSKQKGKEPVVTPVAAVATAEKNILASSKKERPSRAERRAFKASLAEKTNNKTEGETAKVPVKTTAPAPTILKKPHAAQAHAAVSPKAPAAARVPPTGPAASRNANAMATPTASKADATLVQRPGHPAPAITSMGKQAFLKHANASQGITEPLIEEALREFGAIEKVEIDKRKGFAYVDFADSEGLRRAVAAGTVKVAQGAVQVLERKEKHLVPRGFPKSRPQPPRPTQGRGGYGPGGRGGRGGARGGHTISGSAPTSAPVTASTTDVAT